MHDRLERIESIKAGSLGGIAAGSVYGVTIALDRLVLPLAKSMLCLGLEAAIAIVSGFLFGITYRYVIRSDRNHHLNAGAVLAFGLVRGLAQVNVDAFDLSQVWIDGFILAKSVVMFAIARYAVDYALAASWVLPFTQQGQPESTTLNLELTVAARKDQRLG